MGSCAKWRRVEVQRFLKAFAFLRGLINGTIEGGTKRANGRVVAGVDEGGRGRALMTSESFLTPLVFGALGGFSTLGHCSSVPPKAHGAIREELSNRLLNTMRFSELAKFTRRQNAAFFISSRLQDSVHMPFHDTYSPFSLYHTCSPLPLPAGTDGHTYLALTGPIPQASQARQHTQQRKEGGNKKARLAVVPYLT